MMMSETNRRSLLQLVLAAPFAASCLSSPVWAADTSFAPSTQPMRFRRKLERELSDGKWIRVVREFAISFSPRDDGFLVAGEQIGVAVDAPASLRAFSRIEEERVETALFPLTLDCDGFVAELEPAPDAMQAVSEAFLAATSQIEGLPLTELDRTELRAFIAAVHQAGSIVTTKIPLNLFAPGPESQDEERSFALPTGENGRVSSHFSGERDAQTGVMRSAMREVVTEIADDRRRTIETWDLSSL